MKSMLSNKLVLEVLNLHHNEKKRLLNIILEDLNKSSSSIVRAWVEEAGLRWGAHREGLILTEPDIAKTPKVRKVRNSEDSYDRWGRLAASGKMSQIKYWRRLCNLSQKEVAIKLGVTRQDVDKMEKPAYMHKMGMLKKYANIYGIKVKNLIDSEK